MLLLEKDQLQAGNSKSTTSHHAVVAYFPLPAHMKCFIPDRPFRKGFSLNAYTDIKISTDKLLE